MRLRLPASTVEESGHARLFGLAAFVVACLSLAVYGQTYVVPIAAVLMAALGHRFSFARRGSVRGFFRQLLIAGLMFAAIAYFVFDSVVGFFVGQLPQANFVMLLVAITSFDLKTRRNLYSSMWMSLAVIYLAAVFAWDFFFGGFVLAWFACLVGFWSASRLRQMGAAGLRVPLRPAAIAVAATMIAGLGAFWLLPQPSAQPSGPLVISLPNNLSFHGELENPALPLVQFGSDPSGSNGSVDLHYRGRLGDDVVFYVRTGAPAYWRGLVFDSYRGGTWVATDTASKTFHSYVEARELPPAEGAQLGSFVQTFRIVRPGPGVIYVAAPVESIYYPAAQIRRDAYGDWRAPAPHKANTTYSVVSHLPDYTPGSLRATEGPDISRSQLPEYYDSAGLSPRARALAQAYAAGVETGDRYGLVMALTLGLQRDYSYSQQLGRVPPGTDPIDWFLFEARIGYCEQFATAETLMLRSLGVPARLATGYATGEYSPILDQTIVRERDAHAWVEAYFPGHGWVPIDPSPGYSALAATRFPDRWAASGLARLIPHLTLSAPGAVLGSLGAIAAGPALVAVAVALLLGFAWLLARRHGLPLRARSPGQVALLRLYERLQRRLHRPRAPAETPLEYAARFAAAGPAEDLLREITAAVNRGAYADRWPDPAEVSRMESRLP